MASGKIIEQQNKENPFYQIRKKKIKTMAFGDICMNLLINFPGG